MPRLFGLALVGMGTLALIVAFSEYRAVLNHLFSEQYREIAGVGDRRGITPAPVIAVLLILTGLIVTGTIAFRTAAHNAKKAKKCGAWRVSAHHFSWGSQHKGFV